MPPPTYGAAIVGQEIHDSKLINESFDAVYLNIVLTRDLNNRESALYRLLRYTGLFFRLLGILLTHRFDLCYLAITCHGVGFLKDSLFVLTCKLFCKRIVIHQHNKGMSTDARKPVYRTLFPLVYRHTKVILLSGYLFDDISAHVSRNQILICHNGSPGLEVSKETQISKPQPHRIVFLSNLFFDKGVMTFLDCCRILKDRGLPFHADMIGAETAECDRSCLQREIEQRGLSNEIIYHGRKTGVERDRILQSGTYFLFPSRNEAFPLVLLEAMQFHMICLATPVGGIPDIVRDGETGFLCDMDDAAGFAERIVQMEADETGRKTIMENAFGHYRKNFTLEQFERNMLQCLNQALEE